MQYSLCHNASNVHSDNLGVMRRNDLLKIFYWMAKLYYFSKKNYGSLCLVSSISKFKSNVSFGARESSLTLFYLEINDLIR